MIHKALLNAHNFLNMSEINDFRSMVQDHDPGPKGAQILKTRPPSSVTKPCQTYTTAVNLKLLFSQTSS